ncbi:hypothetical protein SAMN04488515_0521 [Cognatiyoonia koreensis]|uniref:Transcriptional activator HlyU n=1 Tax=Cognatiyoonia koreensis TaxID=364200 RepID=A0A1I0NBM8_9RHOB|nr:HlyU family transcriptional regulator [Cognatiyoonia koreensis]SEV98557.1 hypothetical protein SAMN04488515_0521 [Cognatiyoonia koreensis]
MGILSKLFGGGPKTPHAAAQETYKDFTITPAPMKEPGGYRIGATITKTVDGAAQTHQLIRADTINDYDEAVATCVRKSKQMIDEQGDKLFSR